MPFSFNPGQTAAPAQGGGQGIPVPGSAPTASSTLPSVPDSPFLFIQQRGREMTINAYLQIVILLVATLSVLGALVLFAYSFYLSSSIETKKAELAAKEATFKESPLAEMKRLSDRVAGLDVLLKGYVSIRSPLKLLEDVVERQVLFSDFKLTREKTGGYIATFTAVTKDYQSLIQQLEALQLTQYSKIAPTTKLDKFTEEKDLTLRVKIITPIFVQGVLPDDIVFVKPGSPAPVTTPMVVPVAPASTGTPQVSSTTTP